MAKCQLADTLLCMPNMLRNQPVQGRSQVTVTKLLDTTAHLLDLHGYRAATTNLIADQAGVSIGTLYRYFGDKDQILVALRDRVNTEITSLLITTISKLATLPKDEAARQFLEVLVGALEANRGILAAVVGEMPLGTQSNVLP